MHMKKLMFVLVLVLGALVVNAQNNKTPGATDTKTPAASSATTVKVADLPKAITDNIAKDYPGYTVREASSMTGKNGLNYKVSIMKGSETETLLYDNTGKFLKKVSKNDMEHHEKKK